MRILVGTFEIGRHMHDLAAGFRALGHEVDTLALWRNPQHPDLPYTHVLPHDLVDKHLAALQGQPLDALIRHGEGLMQVRSLLTAYDLYVFQFGASLMQANRDYPLLKQLGKKIASVFLGSDVRHWSGVEPIAGHYGLKAPATVYEEPYCQLNTRLHNLRMAERYADAIFSLPFQSELAIRPYWQIHIPLDLSLYDYQVHDREVPVVVHAPTRRSFKGTSAVLEALDRLREEGEQFELRLLENVPNAEVIRALSNADLVIDQLFAPHYGMLGLESMASGCAVIGGNIPGYVPMMRESPVVHASADSVYDVTKVLLRDRNLRRTLAERSRAYVEGFHEVTAVAEAFLEKVDTRSAFEYYPTFYATNYEVPEGEQIHPTVLRLTSEIIARLGLPEGADASRLVAKGLADDSLLGEPIAQWTPLVRNMIAEPWGWCPLHHADEVPDIDRSAMLVEAALEARSRAAEGDVLRAADIFQTCLSELEAAPECANEENVILAIVLAATAMGLAEEAEAYLERGLALYPDSERLNLLARRIRPDQQIVDRFDEGDGAAAAENREQEPQPAESR